MKTFLKVSYVETFYEEFIELDNFPVDIGRDPSSRVVLMGHEISRKHAEIFEKGGEVFLKDSGSRTGIWHEGKRVKELKLTESLQLRIGPAILEFSFINFPLEQTLSFGHEEHQIHHEPLLLRVESLLSGRMLSILFFILLGLSYFTSPDFYRKGDFVKSMALALMGKVLLAPFLIALVVVVVRKLNRGDYAWARSLSLSYLLCIYIGVAELISSSFCWFKYFDLAWNSFFFSILMSAVLVFWWFWAVGKNASNKNRFIRAFYLSAVVYILFAGVSYLSTGYKSNYEIESCNSLTGWHWGKGDNLSSVQDFLAESAKELSE